MAMNFVSEKDIKKGEGEEEPVDNRPLFERLKEVRDKQQAEHEEERKSRYHRALDDGEAEFLESVSRVQAEHEWTKRQEEKALVNAQKEAMKQSEQSSSTSGPKLQVKAGSLMAKAKTTTSTLLVRKRKLSDGEKKDQNGKDSPEKPTGFPKATQLVGEYPSAIIKAGNLPGVGMYESSSDDSFDEDEGMISRPTMLGAVNPAASSSSQDAIRVAKLNTSKANSSCASER